MVSPNNDPSKKQSSELLQSDQTQHPTVSPFRQRIHEIIFGADDFAGALFDVVLLILIVASIVVVCLDTVPDIGRDPLNLSEPGPYHNSLSTLSWVFTFIFHSRIFGSSVLRSSSAQIRLQFLGDH